MRRALNLVLVAIVALTIVYAARPGSPSDEQRAQDLASTIRCPVCDGLSVADSPSSTARAMAADIARRVEAGESNDDIRNDYVGRYGPAVLLDPPASGTSAWLWFAPVGGVAAAVAFAGRGIWVRRHEAARVGETA